MRGRLNVLGGSTLITLAVVGVAVSLVVYKGRTLDAESKAFIDSAVPAIAANWSRNELFERATPELRATVQAERLRSVFDPLAPLGPLVEYQGATGEANMFFILGAGKFVSASYLAKGRFKNGTATFRIVLVRRDGRWMINSFYVDPAPGGKDNRGV
jgi:hypothetical protein